MNRTTENKDVIEVTENGRLFEYAFADLVKYHGNAFPGGLALAFRVMQCGFPLLSSARPPERLEIALETAFPGAGARDGFELVTRMVYSGRYSVNPAVAGPDVPESPSGRYFFRLKYRGRGVDLALRPGLVGEEFLRLTRQKERSAAEELRLDALKTEMATIFLTLPTTALFKLSLSAGA